MDDITTSFYTALDTAPGTVVDAQPKNQVNIVFGDDVNDMEAPYAEVQVPNSWATAEYVVVMSSTTETRCYVGTLGALGLGAADNPVSATVALCD